MSENSRNPSLTAESATLCCLVTENGLTTQLNGWLLVHKFVGPATKSKLQTDLKVMSRMWDENVQHTWVFISGHIMSLLRYRTAPYTCLHCLRGGQGGLWSDVQVVPCISDAQGMFSPDENVPLFPWKQNLSQITVNCVFSNRLCFYWPIQPFHERGNLRASMHTLVPPSFWAEIPTSQGVSDGVVSWKLLTNLKIQLPSYNGIHNRATNNENIMCR